MASESSKTGVQQEKKRKPGTFVKGDPRINRKGRPPANSDELNALLDEIFAEEAVYNDKGATMPKLRLAINRLLSHKNPMGTIHILDRRYGKVKDIVSLEGGETPLVIKIVHDDKPRIEHSPGGKVPPESGGSHRK